MRPENVGSINGLLDEIESEPEVVAMTTTARQAQARLEASLVEQVLFETAMGTGRSGYADQQLFDDLWVYALPVLKAFIRTMRMHQLLCRYQPARPWISIIPEDQVVLRNSEAERDGLAVDTIIRAVKDFRRNALERRKWSPDGGASLRTYFIGTCALNFPRAYQRWSKDRGTRLDSLAARYAICLESVADQVATLDPDPAVSAADRDVLRRIVAVAQPTTKLILALLMQDLTQQQVADELGLTAISVERRMASLRRRARNQRRRAGLEFDPDARQPPAASTAPANAS